MLSSAVSLPPSLFFLPTPPSNFLCSIAFPYLPLSQDDYYEEADELLGDEDDDVYLDGGWYCWWYCTATAAGVRLHHCPCDAQSEAIPIDVLHRPAEAIADDEQDEEAEALRQPVDFGGPDAVAATRADARTAQLEAVRLLFWVQCCPVLCLPCCPAQSLVLKVSRVAASTPFPVCYFVNVHLADTLLCCAVLTPCYAVLCSHRAILC